MMNQTTPLNQTSFNNAPSPYRTNDTVPLFGIGGFQSNLTIVYNQQTVPTPWPYLIVSILISLATAIVGLVSNLKSAREEALLTVPNPRGLHSGGRRAAITALVAFFINTIRSISAFIQAIRAFPSGPVHSSSSAGLALLGVSIQTFIGNPTLNWAMILGSGLEAYLVWVALILTFVSQARHSHAGYARWFLQGGECPRVFADCESIPYAGCPPPEVHLSEMRSINNFHYNRILGTDLIISAIVFAWLVLNPVTFKSVIKREGYLGLSSQKTMLSFTTVFFATIIIAVLLPIQYIQESKPSPIMIRDSSGPYISDASNILFNTSTNASSSWSDCFKVTPVHDKHGFFEHWWNEVHASPINWLSVT